ncbi:MAG TPA: response regulator, partial [Chitinophagaceae bacterium]|nr:response regulator [Chitinophagaceae bacterium]
MNRLTAMPDPLKILLLEDSVTEAEMITGMLRKNGLNFRSRMAGDRASFSLALEVFQPEVVLASNSLQHFPAIDALKMIRGQSLHIAFILTGTVSEEYARDMIRQGADDYIYKDKLSRLPTAIEAAVREKQTEREKFEAHAQLLQSEQKFRTLIERISEGFIS